MLFPKSIFVIVGHQADVVRETVTSSCGKGLRFVLQGKQLGTGHALLCGRKELQRAARHLLVLCGDAPLISAATLRGFLQFYRQSGAAAAVMTAALEDPTGYGRILRSPEGSVAGIVEQKSASPEQLRIREINTGMYCFKSQPLFAALARLPRDPRTGEYYLTDVIGQLHASGQRVVPYLVADPTEVVGINDRVDLVRVDALLRARKVRELLLAGVTILQPETVQIDPDVMVGTDTVIEPGASLRGRTRVGENCRIGSFSIVTDSELADDVTVEPACVIAESKIARGARIGPFARLRPGTRIGPEARIGNFVEVKNAQVGRRTKAQHLTYLGDATVGDDVNIGAGTITCNFDGVQKHRTAIEDNVFIGSGVELVAPLRVGRGAYVAAGSTITEQVPPESLAIARSRQANKPGWAGTRKKTAAKKQHGS